MYRTTFSDDRKCSHWCSEEQLTTCTLKKMCSTNFQLAWKIRSSLEIWNVWETTVWMISWFLKYVIKIISSISTKLVFTRYDIYKIWYVIWWYSTFQFCKRCSLSVPCCSSWLGKKATRVCKIQIFRNYNFVVLCYCGVYWRWFFFTLKKTVSCGALHVV